MEKIERDTNSTCEKIKTLINNLQEENRKTLLEELAKRENNSESESRPPAGITTSVMNTSEVYWRRHLRGFRHLARY